MIKNKDSLNRFDKNFVNQVEFNMRNKEVGEICELLRKSLIEGSTLKVSYYLNQKVIKYHGSIESFHPLDKELLLEDENQNIQILLLANIIDVEE